MSIIQKLSEGIINRDMKQEGQALLNKWSQTGLLEGLQTDRAKQTMARLLENQAKELLRESSSMSAGDVEGFAAVAFPIVRRVFAGLIANDLVSVQPMSLPSGLIFFLDFTFGEKVDGVTGSRMGNIADGTQSIFGTDKLAKGIIDGVGLVDSLKADLGGPGRGGSTGYAYASPSGSNVAALTNGTHIKARSAFKLDGTVSEARAKYIQYDPDLLASTTLGCVVVDINKAEIESIADAADADFNNLSAFLLDETALLAWLNGVTGGAVVGDFSAVANIQQVRRLTRLVSSADSATGAAAVRFVISTDEPAQITTESDTASNGAGNLAIGKLSFPIKDHIPAAGTVGAVQSSSTNYALEGTPNIPEIDIKVDSTAITAQSKKLKAKWTPELGQDLNAYHNLDAEVELTSILSEQIALEIDREILADLVNGATAATYYWSRSPGLFVNKTTGSEIGQTSAAPDFTGTVSEWYETLIETINDVSAQIHRKTLRGGANYVIVSPEVANILEFTSGFRANVTADADKGDIGAVKAGSLSRKFDVIVDPYFPRNVVLVGRKGSSFLESGYVYAPYVPLQTTPTIFGPEDFVPRKGVMTRYAKKMVRPDMYGLVIVRGLLGEAGATS